MLIEHIIKQTVDLQGFRVHASGKNRAGLLPRSLPTPAHAQNRAHICVRYRKSQGTPDGHQLGSSRLAAAPTPLPIITSTK
jgi:hypothetical protein